MFDKNYVNFESLQQELALKLQETELKTRYEVLAKEASNVFVQTGSLKNYPLYHELCAYADGLWHRGLAEHFGPTQKPFQIN